MYVCGRCVFVLSARLMRVKTQQSFQNLKLTTCQFSKSKNDFTAVDQSRSHKDKLKGYNIRYCSDQQTGLSSRQTTESILEEELDKNSLVASRTLNVLQIPSTTTASAENISIDLDAVSSPSPFEEVSEDDAIQIPVPSDLPPTTFTLRDYVDKSETLTKLVNLGVNLSKLEERPNVGSMLVRLDFQKDVAPRLLFLKDLGIEYSQLGPILTKNPFLLTESIEHLQDRVSYLKSKTFSSQSVAVMVNKAPYLLNFSVQRLDNRMGFFQQQLGLSAQKTKNLLTRLPRLLCGSLEPVKENLKVCELELGFHRNEIQHIVTVVPKVLTTNKRKLTQIFDFIHNIMGVPHSLIAKFPQVLNAKLLRIRERHLFLEYLGRANYEPTDPNYISLERLVTLPDEIFCTEVALASLDDFERFQKTL